jgi:hypothetical protein
VVPFRRRGRAVTTFSRAEYERAARAQREARARPPHPVPARITLALDLRGLDGPEVDHACGVQEPAVDEWEAGTRIPTEEQLAALAWLTDLPVAFFYQPVMDPTRGVWLCGHSGPKGGGRAVCETVDQSDPIQQPQPGAPVGGLDWAGPAQPELF